MKKLVFLLSVVLFAVCTISCNKSQTIPGPQPQPVKLNRDSVQAALRYPLYVAEAYRFIGADSTDIIKEDTLLNLYRNAVSLQFYFGTASIDFWGLTPMQNTEISGAAKTFWKAIKVSRSTGLGARWDDEKNTVVVESKYVTTSFPMVIPGRKGYLEASSFRHYWTWQQAQAAAVKPRMVFIYEDQDPKLGKVTYKIILKPLYQYYRDPYDLAYAKFVLF